MIIEKYKQWINEFKRSSMGLPLLGVVTYMGIGLLSRIALILFNGDASILDIPSTIGVIVLGIAYDFVVGSVWAIPLVLLSVVCGPGRIARRLFAGLGFTLFTLLIGLWLFIAAAEFYFWNEFASRFNFIAVDYLLFTREVIGNIRESYNLNWLWLGLALTSLLVVLALKKPLTEVLWSKGEALLRRCLWTVVYVIACALMLFGVSSEWKNYLVQPQLVQLAGNGTWEFFHALRYNEIDYQSFYVTSSEQELSDLLRKEVGSKETFADRPPQTHRIEGGASDYKNVVLISIESFGSEFIESHGGKPGLTPCFERLANEGMHFKQLYATGNRTVRGLEAITLSVPPTPGHAILMRPNNSNLYTLGGVFRSKGYEAVYLYGGYSYFDNMKAFFSGNGYTVLDRTDIASEKVTHETIWGVADEDLYEKALEVLDESNESPAPIFLHVMTTSNHRPYTYPDGRIDIPSGTGRDGAVKYTDFALGAFIEKAKQRTWFDDTIFVIVADHSSIARGRTDLPMERYHIPMVIYAPSIIKPCVIETPASQIDVGPTLLGVLQLDYISEFFGQDILREGEIHPRIFLCNYQTVGFVEDNTLVELRPNRKLRLCDPTSGDLVPSVQNEESLVTKAIAFYQLAAKQFSANTLMSRKSYNNY